MLTRHIWTCGALVCMKMSWRSALFTGPGGSALTACLHHSKDRTRVDDAPVPELQYRSQPCFANTRFGCAAHARVVRDVSRRMVVSNSTRSSRSSPIATCNASSAWSKHQYYDIPCLAQHTRCLPWMIFLAETPSTSCFHGR